MKREHRIDIEPQHLRYNVQVVQRAASYRDLLEKRYAALAHEIDHGTDPQAVRAAVYTLAMVSDELAKVQWILGERASNLEVKS